MASTSKMTGWRRRPYLLVSLAAHACLLGAVFYVGPYSIRTATLDRHVQQAREVDLKRRVEELEKIKSMLEKSERGPQQAGSGKTGAAASATPQQMLEQARSLSEAIAQIDRRAKARELARLLNISELEAQRKLGPVAARPPIKAADKANTGQVLAEVKQHQALARAALLKRAQQLEKEQNGTALRPPNGKADGKADQHQGGRLTALAGLGDGGVGEAGKGGAGEHGVKGEDVPNAANIAITSYIDQAGIGPGQAPRGGSWDLSTPKHSVARGYGAFTPTTGLAGGGAARKISAHAIGNGAPYADRIYLNRWHIVGPFAGHGPQDSIDVVYPPEMSVDLDAQYAGVGGRTLRWEYLTNPDYPTVAPVRAQDALYYAYTEVVMSEAADLVLAIGGDDDTKLWFNERLVWVSGDGFKTWYSSPGYVGLPKEIQDWNLSEGTRKLHFKKGRNSLLVKLYNGASLMFFSVVIVADGQ